MIFVSHSFETSKIEFRWDEISLWMITKAFTLRLTQVENNFRARHTKIVGLEKNFLLI